MPGELRDRALTRQAIQYTISIEMRHVSDLRAGWRALSELCARRPTREFSADQIRLLRGTGSANRPTIGHGFGEPPSAAQITLSSMSPKPTSQLCAAERVPDPVSEYGARGNPLPGRPFVFRL